MRSAARARSACRLGAPRLEHRAVTERRTSESHRAGATRWRTRPPRREPPRRCFDPRRHSRFVIIAAEARIANSGGRRSCVRATAARARVPRGPRGVGADLAGGARPRPARARAPRTHRACPTRGYGGGVRVTRPACKLEGQPDAGAIARIRRDPDGRARDRGRRGRPRGGDRDRSRRGDRGDGGPREVFQRACANATGPPGDAESAERPELDSFGLVHRRAGLCFARAESGADGREDSPHRAPARRATVIGVDTHDTVTHESPMSDRLATVRTVTARPGGRPRHDTHRDE